MKSARALRIAGVSRTVADLARAVAFHTEAFGFRVVGETTHDESPWGRLMGVPGLRSQSFTLRLGAQELELVKFDPPGAMYPAHGSTADLWSQHIAISVSDIDAAFSRLCGYSFTPITEGGPRRLPPQRAASYAYRFRDPDGHPLELIEFPDGTLHAWQRPCGLFLGIDHIAINVAELDRSIDFYAHSLGFNVAVRSPDTGKTHEQLDPMCADLVDTVKLHPENAGPPHLELFERRRPMRQPIAHSTRVNDICADRMVLEVDDVSELIHDFRHGDFVSAAAVSEFGNQNAILGRDPAGHFLQLFSGKGHTKPSRTRDGSFRPAEHSRETHLSHGGLGRLC